MSLADPRIATWQHIVKIEQNQYPDGDFPPGKYRDYKAQDEPPVDHTRTVSVTLPPLVVPPPDPPPPPADAAMPPLTPSSSQAPPQGSPNGPPAKMPAELALDRRLSPELRFAQGAGHGGGAPAE